MVDSGQAWKLAAGLLASFFVCVIHPSGSGADPSRLAPSLTYLAEEFASRERSLPVKEITAIPLTLRFQFALSDEQILDLEALGASLDRRDGEVRHLGSVYRAHVSPVCLSKIADFPSLEWAESDWRPGLVPAMNVSRAEIQAEPAWDAGLTGGPDRTGRGIVIANFDTGIDLLHPAFWFADGDTLAWVDINGTRQFEPGTDGVDLNEDGLLGPDEVLRFWEGKVEDEHDLIPNRIGEFEVDRDWLYLDRNGNRMRDAGHARGFTEAEPVFGEPVFLVLDSNGDNNLDVGERLAALKTCKVRAVLEPGSKERRRGRDLIWAERDPHGHGTSVAGILVGEGPGRLLSGVAPGAELLVADAFNGANLGELILWALDEKADVMLYELGNWVWDYMDGSSNVEQMMDFAAAKGVVQVAAAGNLAGSRKHCRVTATAASPSQIRMRCPASEATHIIWGSFLWRDAVQDVKIRIRSPWNSWVTLSGTGSQSAAGVRYWSSKGTSPRGTTGMFFSIEREDDLGGGWLVEIHSQDGSVRVDGYVMDDRSGWTDGTIFIDGVSDESTVAWPANADSAISVASYGTRGLRVDAGQLSRFSSRGPRIDGEPVIDVAAPGNYDIRTCRSSGLADVAGGTYTSFGGTSAAAAHVAGVAALLLQGTPNLGHSGVKFVLTESASEDEFTGEGPSLEWGFGKLNALSAVTMALGTDISPQPNPFTKPQQVAVERNYPNPFNPTTTIQFRNDAPGRVSLRIFDVRGRLIRILFEQWLTPGEWEAVWDGTNDWAQRVPSGFYFCRVESDGESASGKMLLLE